ncbi:hypothetical protein CTAYLR_009311 [Chrysophaeum taylorii]|uniref:Sulfotransferase n=1 Tax=Chrysophaeum taylorii TaxID=2483200 RepID=A0AAD7UI12_9STRA|nr:hypothetical protein CTAYLR_009311 [Chrysophaeum taylorii]
MVVEASRQTIPMLREMMCGRTSAHPIVFGVAVGRDRRGVEAHMAARLNERLSRVGTSRLARRLLGAAETEDFDFRVFDDVDAVVGGLVAAHWQELAAAYPNARFIIAVNNGKPQRIPFDECRRFDEAGVTEAIALYGSACPSATQIAKCDDVMASEMMETAPNLQVWDSRWLKPTSKAWEPPVLGTATSSHPLIVCPGAGATATKSLAKALRDLEYANVDHNKLTQRVLELASETAVDARAFEAFDAVLDTPIPGYWQELLATFPNAKIVLTVRDDYDRSYASRFDGLFSQTEWTRARHDRFERPRDDRNATPQVVVSRKIPPVDCATKRRCEAACETLGGDDDALRVLSIWGDRHCRIAYLPTRFDLVRDFALDVAALASSSNASSVSSSSSAAAASNIIKKGRSLQHHKGRLSLYGTICPSKMTALKTVNNNNRHILRRTPADRLLVMDITQGDGYDLLCPFLGIPQDKCPTEPFPNSKEFHKPRGLGKRKSRSRRRRRLLLLDDTSAAAAAAAAAAANVTCLCDQARGVTPAQAPQTRFEWVV